MMNNIVTDMKAAVNLFKDMRKARREGTGVVIKRCRELPLVKSGPGFYDTPEGCNLNHCGRVIDREAREAFAALPYEEKRRMCFTPKAGEYVERAEFWRNMLEPVLTDKELRAAMMRLLRLYIYCKRREMEISGYKMIGGRA